MNELPIILVQGPESAQHLLQQYGTTKVKKWIVCNAYSGGMFIEKGIPFVDESFYFDNGMKQINEIKAFAHRLSTVKNCDTIFLLNKGQLVNKGTFDELIKDNDQFRDSAKNI